MLNVHQLDTLLVERQAPFLIFFKKVVNKS